MFCATKIAKKSNLLLVNQFHYITVDHYGRESCIITSGVNMKTKYIFLLPLLLLPLFYFNCSVKAPVEVASPTCTTLLCSASKYSLIVADIDGSNASLIKTSTFQDMTHPRVSNDKNWVAYTTYNKLNSENCATVDQGYLNTEIRTIQISGVGDKVVVSPVATDLNSNNYWVGTTNEFTYLSGPPTALKFYRSTVDSNMNVISGPTQISVVGTIVPMDPATHAGTGKIVFPGLYNPGGGYVKSIFMMNLADSTSLVGLSIGRDHAGTPLVCSTAACSNIMENDPKVSPDGSKVAFMRQAPESGTNGFGWHIFVVPVASPQNEVDISYSALGSDVLKNDVLPEWVSNSQLIFSTIEIVSASNFTKEVYTMSADGTGRAKISLPTGFRYADVFPFVDSGGKSRIILSAEKIGAVCTP